MSSALIDWMEWQIEANGMSAAAVARSLNATVRSGTQLTPVSQNP
jgi:hypothetical protein